MRVTRVFPIVACLGLLACGGDTPTGSGHFTVIYGITVTSLVHADSVRFLDAHGATAVVAAPVSGWSVVFSVPAGQSIGATAFLTSTGGGTAVLRESWNGGGVTLSDSSHAATGAAGTFKLTLPAHTAN